MIWIYKDFNFKQIAEVFGKRGNYVWMSMALAFGIFANVLRSLRWKMLLNSSGIRIKTRRAIELVFISYMINSVTPRLGELVRCLLIRQGNVKITSRALGTVVIEKLSDVICLLLLVAAVISFNWEMTLTFTQSVGNSIKQAVPAYTLYICFGFLALLALAFLFPLRKQVRAFLTNLWCGISAIARLDHTWEYILLCIFIWGCNFMQLYLLIPCFEYLSFLSWSEALPVFAYASIGMLLPTPGGMGSWHYAITTILNEAYHVELQLAKAFALFTHGLRTVLVMIMGCLAYATFYWEVIRSKIKLKKQGKDNT